MAEKIRFKAVTGECRFCGMNKYRFDEKEQTFICEYCGAEVYIAEEETANDEDITKVTYETENKPYNYEDEDNSYDDAILECEKASNEEPEETEPLTCTSISSSYSDFGCGASLTQGMVCVIFGVIMNAISTILNVKVFNNASAQEITTSVSQDVSQLNLDIGWSLSGAMSGPMATMWPMMRLLMTMTGFAMIFFGLYRVVKAFTFDRYY